MTNNVKLPEVCSHCLRAEYEDKRTQTPWEVGGVPLYADGRHFKCGRIFYINEYNGDLYQELTDTATCPADTLSLTQSALRLACKNPDVYLRLAAKRKESTNVNRS